MTALPHRHGSVPNGFDIARYFGGDWQLSRRIIDRRAGLAGRLSGTASFTVEGNELLYRETGRMTYGAHDGPATQSYRWHLSGPHQAEIHFQDGRFFHHLDLTAHPGGFMQAGAGHDCAPDRYDGRYRLLSPLQWWTAWLIAGPRKDMVLISRYRRIRG